MEQPHTGYLCGLECKKIKGALHGRHIGDPKKSSTIRWIRADALLPLVIVEHGSSKPGIWYQSPDADDFDSVDLCSAFPPLHAVVLFAGTWCMVF